MIITPVLLLQTSCKKWLDVKPKAQIEADVLYQREAGFKDVLTGAYVNMASPAMYGREMTFGFVDAIGNTYGSATAGSVYAYARTHQYDNTGVEQLITGIWRSSYNTIANLNNLIARLEVADKTMFSPDNYNVIFGEAIALRAFLHFDLLRLFAPSYKTGAGSLAIPYITESGFTTTPELPVNRVMENVINDLKKAAALLELSDPIVTGREITSIIDDGYLMQRNYKCNYYAVQGILARAYMYTGDFVNAGKAADLIIDSKLFAWVKVDNIAVTDDAVRDRTFSSEQVFVLNTPKMADYIMDRLQYSAFGTAGAYGLFFSTADINRLFPEANDWRKLYFWTEERSGVTTERFNTKLWQPQTMPLNFSRKMPLMRLPELYLISADASLATNPDKTISRLRALRVQRGLDAGIPDGTSEVALRNEITLEYHREFICEGQLFYYYKQMDADMMDGVAGSFDKSKYVIPKPIEETEFR